MQKILLARPSFRMGNSILATPLIFLFRQNFPKARIDFVGSPISSVLFQHLPIERHYQVTRRFPHASWAYPRLITEIRSVGYDLAVELSGSQSAMGAWIVGLSGSRYRVGLQGKRSHWYNVKLPKPTDRNKYEVSRALASSMGLSGDPPPPKVVLSDPEKHEALKKIARYFGDHITPDVGVFLGGRARKQKQWPKENFLEVIKELRQRGLKLLIFVGPEEEDLIEYFRWALSGQVPIIYKKAVRRFAAMLSTCKVFVTCDSGPMHLACALGVRAIAIFRKDNVEHWAPPSTLARVVQGAPDVSSSRVVRACLLELWRIEKASAPQ
jgi:heptosyltransferase-3